MALLVPVGMTVALAQAPADQPVPHSALSPQQLDNLVAPLALYPDPVLSQVLVAATYPLEVVEANQWLQQNRQLTGTALMDAAKQQNWDPSVQALVAFPDVLTRLNQDVRWTTDLGNAFLGQQTDVMAAIQRLRARAQANGKLRTTPQETVTTQTQNGQSEIAIQPADPQIVYVPSYDPTYIWGAPAYGYYPPLFYPTYGFGWGFGIPIGGFFFGWPGWGGYGWGFNWFGGGPFINGGFFGRYGYGFGGFRGGFAGHQAWAHNYARASRATGTAGYSRSYSGGRQSRRSCRRSGSQCGSGLSVEAQRQALGQAQPRVRAIGRALRLDLLAEATAVNRPLAATRLRGAVTPLQPLAVLLRQHAATRLHRVAIQAAVVAADSMAAAVAGSHGGGGGGGSHGGGGHR